MKNVLETIFRALVDHPQELRLKDLTGARTVIWEVSCHPEDIGKVIGKGGKTISAVRALAGALAARSNRRALVEVVE